MLTSSLTTASQKLLYAKSPAYFVFASDVPSFALALRAQKAIDSAISFFISILQLVHEYGYKPLGIYD
jgi:hypothetical protein